MCSPSPVAGAIQIPQLVTLTQKNKMEGMGKQLMKQVSNSWKDDKINQWPAINSIGHVQMFCSGTSVET